MSALHSNIFLLENHLLLKWLHRILKYTQGLPNENESVSSAVSLIHLRITKLQMLIPLTGLLNSVQEYCLQ